MTNIKEYKRQWAVKNKDKIKEQQHAYYLLNADKIKKRSSDRYKLTPPDRIKTNACARKRYKTSAKEREKRRMVRLSKRQWYIDYSRNHHYMNKYKISFNDAVKILESQNGLCDICKITVTPCNPIKQNRMHLDHDHATGKVRGVLCHRCNTGLGMLQDRVDLLDSAKAYLIKHSSVQLSTPDQSLNLGNQKTHAPSQQVEDKQSLLGFVQADDSIH
jgi:hypothetical protein